MKPAQPPRTPGRPRDGNKRQAIIDAGWALFLEHGVGSAQIEAIAAKAGVSKVTLYSHFPGKPALFEAAIRQRMDHLESLQVPQMSEASLESTLEQFGSGLLHFLASAEAIDFYAVLSGELRRHPALAQLFYANGPGKTHANLTAIISDATGRHELAVPDPRLAAEELIGLWQGLSNYQLPLGIDTGALIADIPARVRRGIVVFLKAYRAGPQQ